MKAAIWKRTNFFGQLILAVLREIFDESAYARFLSRHRLPRSRASYSAFRREHEQNKAMRPRCC